MLKGLTKLRKEILNLIERSKVPLCAEEIYQNLDEKPNLSSVYRGLCYLEEREMIKSITFDGNTRYFFKATEHPRHYLYCKMCGRLEAFDICFANRIQKELEKKHDYKILDHIFYFVGICSECRKKLSEQ
ncbi:MAG: transcriptional repressor [Thermotogae bacterium]|uniref:Transcriptional repressor n=1 Tax=Kosmotoga arenicorallina TaxID=688066 RepID=A0A7C5HPJ7_9BACT|nr:transcriptional repressor [Kosmotoga sp.]MBO8166413.1 transcriptional repressor [Kosmotoga sp.]RKX48441.1 MAG: transcriptional repressor [Thermotogota bacterium]HHF08786.1 transcriptional repressor [Kosmotoga arenicorallina]